MQKASGWELPDNPCGSPNAMTQIPSDATYIHTVGDQDEHAKSLHTHK